MKRSFLHLVLQLAGVCAIAQIKTSEIEVVEGVSTTISNPSGGFDAANYLIVESTTADNNHYPGIELRGGSLASSYPFISITNGGLGLSLYGGYSATYDQRLNMSISSNSPGSSYFRWLRDSTSLMHLDGNTGSLGIGTSSPGAPLEVDGGPNLGRIKVTGENTGYTQADILLQTSNSNTPFWRGTGIYTFNEGTDANWYFGNPYGNASDQFAINRKANTSFDVSTASSSEATNMLTILNNGYVGIGTSLPAYKLDVNGTIRSSNVSASDRRWKTNITPIPSATQTLNQINPVSYTWRQEEFPEKNFDDRKHYGVIAQELEKIMPELVSTDNEGYKSVEYNSLIAILVKALQEKDEEIKALKENFETRMTRLESQINSANQVTKKSNTK